jgi:hypothetical protein
MISILPYAAGIGCSLCSGTATVMEQVAARKHKNINSVHVKTLINLFRKLPYASGILLDLIGWGLFIFAARELPLFLALSFAASSLAVTVIVAHFYLHVKTSLTTRAAVLILILGLVVIGLTAQPSTAKITSHLFTVVVETAVIPAFVVGLWLLKGHAKHYSPLLLSALAGLTFGAAGLLARAIHFTGFSGIFQFSILCLIIYGILGAVYLAAALQRENINIVSGVLFASELTVPSLLGILFLGDRARGGMWPLVLVGFLFIIVSTGIIALKSEAEATS